MFLEYFYWNYVAVPRWLWQFCWHLELALLKFFSVPLMLSTLFSPWHRDSLPYSGGRISQYVTVFFLNQISRAIGVIIRTAVLLAYLAAQILYALFVVLSFGAVVAAPWLILIGFLTGIFFVIGLSGI